LQDSDRARAPAVRVWKTTVPSGMASSSQLSGERRGLEEAGSKKRLGIPSSQPAQNIQVRRVEVEMFRYSMMPLESAGDGEAAAKGMLAENSVKTASCACVPDFHSRKHRQLVEVGSAGPSEARLVRCRFVRHVSFRLVSS